MQNYILYVGLLYIANFSHVVIHSPTGFKIPPSESYLLHVIISSSLESIFGCVASPSIALSSLIKMSGENFFTGHGAPMPKSRVLNGGLFGYVDDAFASRTLILEEMEDIISPSSSKLTSAAPSLDSVGGLKLSSIFYILFYWFQF